ncbi:hypothetical protein [Actinomadura oligospora]|uniref:hypothetical protein n=1 Tax=Actinomadura oligospora TaxID=111804 RepID=UPI00047A5FFD|nr:hypothetical protein [Actinomadura oligospora]
MTSRRYAALAAGALAVGLATAPARPAAAQTTLTCEWGSLTLQQSSSVLRGEDCKHAPGGGGKPYEIFVRRLVVNGQPSPARTVHCQTGGPLPNSWADCTP